MRRHFVTIAIGFSATAFAHQTNADGYSLKVDVVRKGDELHTTATFWVPLGKCQAYRFLTDYDASTDIPGVLSSKTTRLGDNRAKVELELEEKILLFPVRMTSVLEFTEFPLVGTDFVQIRGDIQSYHGRWRLVEDADGTLYKYQAVAKPDSALPIFVIKYFLKNSLAERFGAIAKIASERKNLTAGLACG